MSGAGKRRRGGGGHRQPSRQESSKTVPKQLPAQFDGPSTQGSPHPPAGPRPQPAGAVGPNVPVNSPATSPRIPSVGSLMPASQGPLSPHQNITQCMSIQTGDPARDRVPRLTDMCRNVDLPPDAYQLDNMFFAPIELARRPGFNTTGREVNLAVNTYLITQFPTKTVYQYDVHIGNGSEKRIVMQKVWDSSVRKAKVGHNFIFDGSKLAWSLVKLDHDINVMVDLDAEQGRTKGKTPNVFRLVVRRTKTVNLAAVEEFLRGNASLLGDALEGLNFLDHVMRETPSRKFIPIKRSFFSEDNKKDHLSGGVFAYKGMYQAIRVVHPGRLAVNIDVSNSCFWALYSLIGAAIEVLDLRDVQQLISISKPEEDGHGGRIPSKQSATLTRFHKLIVKANYRGCPCPHKEWTIKGFVLANAKEYTIDIRDGATGNVRTMNIYDYFKSRYNVILNYWELPLVQMTKKNVVYPMEVLAIYRAQKYPYKLNEIQTANMIKFAVSRPSERRQAIEDSKATFQHPTDPVLTAFGLKIDDKMMRTKGRLLPNPEILFGGNQRVNPGTNGRWDLRGKKFYSRNSKPLRSWGVGVFRGRNPLSLTQVEAFCDALVRTYQGHGGDVLSTRPHIAEVTSDAAEAAYALFHETGNRFNQRPELLIFIVADRNSFHYTRIKKSCDCRFGVASQVLQSAQVVKCNGQYISNVLMKINAKLGGTTARVSSKITNGLPPFTMIVGADVSHSSPGSVAPSMAAMTVSMDQFGGRYNAACETNGEHVEIITQANIQSMLSPLFREWVMTIGQGRVPQNLYYFRDGVSEGQFQHVLQQEIPFIKGILKEINQGNEWQGKLTVVVASKRHHIRAFPDPGDRSAADRNGNPFPGTLVEKDVTNPRDWDFFLWSHVALQGTARPVHYHVLVDGIGNSPKQLQNMIYEHCYQYMRSTTSVSLFPAVYYAHLASNRARSHENVPASSGPRSGPGIKQNRPPPTEPPKAEAPQLLPIFDKDRLAFKMWYI